MMQYPNSPPSSPPINFAPNSPSALSVESEGNFSQSSNCDNEQKEKRMNTGLGPPVERETGRLNLTRNPSYRPARHPTTPLVSFKFK